MPSYNFELHKYKQDLLIPIYCKIFFKIVIKNNKNLQKKTRHFGWIKQTNLTKPPNVPLAGTKQGFRGKASKPTPEGCRQKLALTVRRQRKKKSWNNYIIPKAIANFLAPFQPPPVVVVVQREKNHCFDASSLLRLHLTCFTTWKRRVGRVVEERNFSGNEAPVRKFCAVDSLGRVLNRLFGARENLQQYLWKVWAANVWICSYAGYGLTWNVLLNMQTGKVAWHVR